MPRKNPIPSEEKAICRRLREFRKAVGLTQSQFARRVGLSWRAYSNYELGRVKLNYAAARAVFLAFPKLDPSWLAEAVGIMTGGPYFITLPKPGERGEPSGAPFSLVYSMWLKQELLLSRSGWVDGDGTIPLFRVGDSVEGRITGKALFGEVIGGYLKQLPNGRVDSFLNAAKNCVNEIFEQQPKDGVIAIDARAKAMDGLEMLQPSPPNFSNADLTNTATPVSDAAMQGMWPALKKQLQQKTEKTGKSALAKFLKVDLTRVSQWLTDAKSQREPGAEYALQMQDWLKRPQN